MQARFGAAAGGLLIAAVVALWFSGSTVMGQSAPANATGVITGVVTSEKGPEAGVWVIAETDDLNTKFRKIVVTNDQGRFLVPELPRANYRVWVRGYGLADSKPVNGRAGQDLKLTATVARTPQEAAKIYPANYWLSLMEMPKPNEFPGTGAEGNGILPSTQTRDEYMYTMKGCLRCHQVGNEWTRQHPAGEFTSTIEGWRRRVQMGQRAGEMADWMRRLGPRGLEMFANWSDRIAAGEVPEAPPRPRGPERNVVLTQWQWVNNMGKIHDEVSTDKRNPRLNAHGPIFGSEIANDYLAVLYPQTNISELLRIPTLVPREKMNAAYGQAGIKTSRIADLDRFNPTSNHNPMMDSKGRVWYTATLRPPGDQPDLCKAGSDNKYATYFPLARAGRNVSYYDPTNRRFRMIDTCFGTHHLQFGFDGNETLFLGQPGGAVFGWINTKLFDETGDGWRAQGWCPQVVDTNGDGRITKPWNEPVRQRNTQFEEDIAEVEYENFDASRDTRVEIGAYGLIVNPADGSVWGAQESYPGKIVRLSLGNNPPETCIAEVFEVPSERMGVDPASGQAGFMPRGLDIDKNGVLWTALSGSNHLASFDRRKCVGAVNGRAAHLGRHCKEGWELHPLPSPTFKGTNVRSDYYYYNWVDQFNTLGLGENVPIATGTGSDSLIALLPGTKQPVVMRVPYPLAGFHPRGLDGRIDDPNAGWKGRGIYSSTGADTVWHSEGGLARKDGKYYSVSRPILVKFQVRPDPLAR
jgi:hypothetical protein